MHWKGSLGKASEAIDAELSARVLHLTLPRI